VTVRKSYGLSSGCGYAPNGAVGMLRGQRVIAEYLDVSVATVKKLQRDYGMPLVPLLGAYWTTPSLLDAWLLDQLELAQREQRTFNARAQTIDGE